MPNIDHNTSIIADVFAAQNRIMNGVDPTGVEKAVAVYFELFKHPATHRRACLELGRFCILKRNYDTAMHYLSRGALSFEPNLHIASVDCAVLIASTLLDKECTYRTHEKEQNRTIAIETLKLVQHMLKSDPTYDGQFLSYQAAACTNGVDLDAEADFGFEDGPVGIYKIVHQTTSLRGEAEGVVRFLATRQRERAINQYAFDTILELTAQVGPDYMKTLANDY